MNDQLLESRAAVNCARARLTPTTRQWRAELEEAFQLVVVSYSPEMVRLEENGHDYYFAPRLCHLEVDRWTMLGLLLDRDHRGTTVDGLLVEAWSENWDTSEEGEEPDPAGRWSHYEFATMLWERTTDDRALKGRCYDGERAEKDWGFTGWGKLTLQAEPS